MSGNDTKVTVSSKYIEERDTEENYKIFSHQGRLGIRMRLVQETLGLEAKPVLEGGDER